MALISGIYSFSIDISRLSSVVSLLTRLTIICMLMDDAWD